jgi:ribosomal protein L40E
MLHHHLWMPMDFNFDPFNFHVMPPFVALVLGAAVLLAVTSFGSAARQQRRLRQGGVPVVCRACGAHLPPFARFCSRCGRKL